MFDQDKINWYRTPIDKNTLKRLTERSDAKAFARIVPQLLLTAALGVAAYWSWDHLPVALSLAVFYIYGTVFSFIGLSGAGHELSHGTPFKTKFWNELFMRLTAFLTWTNYVHFRASHAGHHQLTTHSGRDLEVIQPIAIRRRDYLYAFTCNPPAVKMALLTLARHSVNRLEGEWEHRIFPDTEPNKRRAMVNWARLMLIGQTALAAGFIATGHWRLLFLVTLAPFYAGWLNFPLLGHPTRGLNL
jgi:fatty acid desaturase